MLAHFNLDSGGFLVCSSLFPFRSRYLLNLITAAAAAAAAAAVVVALLAATAAYNYDDAASAAVVVVIFPHVACRCLV